MRERVASTLLRHLDRERFEIHLALLSREGIFLAALPDDVIVHDLGGVRTRKAWGVVLSLVRRLRPDVVFSSHRRVNDLLVISAPLPKGAPVGGPGAERAQPGCNWFLAGEGPSSAAASKSRLHHLPDHGDGERVRRDLSDP